jgi:nicotinamide mononucleotide transporter
MILSNIYDLLIGNIRSESPVEFVAVFFGLVSVLYERKGNILVFPTGIISVLIYVYICFHAKLYADMMINGYYFIMSIYGWHYWLRRDKTNQNTPITWCDKSEIKKYFLIFTISFILLYIILKYFTDSDVPVMDSLTTSVFVSGMILLARKKIENWIAWIIGNFIAIPLFFYKGLVLTSLQFLVFFILAISGYYMWKKLLHQQPA